LIYEDISAEFKSNLSILPLNMIKYTQESCFKYDTLYTHQSYLDLQQRDQSFSASASYPHIVNSHAVIMY